MSDLKKGDIVWLKSGSPKMTVDSVNVGGCVCIWFDGKEAKKYVFDVESLTKEEKTTPPEPTGKQF